MKQFFSDLLDGLLAPIGAVMMLPMMTDSWGTQKTSNSTTQKTNNDTQKANNGEAEKANFGPDDQVLEVVEFKKDVQED